MTNESMTPAKQTLSSKKIVSLAAAKYSAHLPIGLLLPYQAQVQHSLTCSVKELCHTFRQGRQKLQNRNTAACTLHERPKCGSSQA